ncbi:MAG: dATP/dGTP diphosphohydrolase domain-containing protein [Pseudomonadota bacterium]
MPPANPPVEYSKIVADNRTAAELAEVGRAAAAFAASTHTAAATQAAPGDWLNSLNSDERKGTPIWSGALMYWPDALAALARFSKYGNDKHNPGQPLHWNREKSSDHKDCVARHLIGLGGKDTDGMRHELGMAWRALAVLQLAIERNPEDFK